MEHCLKLKERCDILQNTFRPLINDFGGLFKWSHEVIIMFGHIDCCFFQFIFFIRAFSEGQKWKLAFVPSFLYSFVYWFLIFRLPCDFLFRQMVYSAYRPWQFKSLPNFSSTSKPTFGHYASAFLQVKIWMGRGLDQPGLKLLSTQVSQIVVVS